MNIFFRYLALRFALATAAMLAIGFSLPAGVAAQEATSLEDYASKEEPPLFDSSAAAVDAFKAALANDDFDGLARLLGLDAAKLRTSEGVLDTLARMKEGAAKKIVVRDMGDDRQVIDIGNDLWPFPFPGRQGQ